MGRWIQIHDEVCANAGELDCAVEHRVFAIEKKKFGVNTLSTREL